MKTMVTVEGSAFEKLKTLKKEYKALHKKNITYIDIVFRLIMGAKVGDL